MAYYYKGYRVESINGKKCFLKLNPDWSLTVKTKLEGAGILLTEDKCNINFRQDDFIKRTRKGKKIVQSFLPVSHCKALYYNAYIEFIEKALLKQSAKVKIELIPYKSYPLSEGGGHFWIDNIGRTHIFRKQFKV